MTTTPATREPALHSTETYERRLPVPPAVVFQAWTDPDVKQRWFAPTASRYELDATPGGTEVLEADVDGVTVEFRATFHDVVTDQRIVSTSTLRPDGRLSTAAIETVELADDGDGGTLLTVTEQTTYVDEFERPEWRDAGIRGQLDAVAETLVDGR